MAGAQQNSVGGQFALQKLAQPTPPRRACPNFLPSFASRSHEQKNTSSAIFNNLQKLPSESPKSLLYPQSRTGGGTLWVALWVRLPTPGVTNVYRSSNRSQSP